MSFGSKGIGRSNFQHSYATKDEAQEKYSVIPFTPHKNNKIGSKVVMVAAVATIIFIASIALNSPFFVVGGSLWIHGTATVLAGKVLVYIGLAGIAIAAAGQSCGVISCIYLNHSNTPVGTTVKGIFTRSKKASSSEEADPTS